MMMSIEQMVHYSYTMLYKLYMRKTVATSKHALPVILLFFGNWAIRKREEEKQRVMRWKEEEEEDFLSLAFC